MDKHYCGEIHIQYTYSEEVEAKSKKEAQAKLENLARFQFKHTHNSNGFDTIEKVVIDNIEDLAGEY